MPYFIYILKCADGTFYTGSTNDLKKRLHTHNNLKAGALYTRWRRPVEMIYHEEYQSKSEAMIREYQIKKLPRKQKEKLVETVQE